MFRGFLLLLFALSVGPAVTLAAPAMHAMQLPPQPKVRPAGLPENVILLSPCVPKMGEHWGQLKNMPTGPFYGTYKGKLVFTEIMITMDQLKKGFTWTNLRGLPGSKIDHVDFTFEPHGHQGLPFPHYDLHAYYVTPQEQALICPKNVLH